MGEGNEVEHIDKNSDYVQNVMRSVGLFFIYVPFQHAVITFVLHVVVLFLWY